MCQLCPHQYGAFQPTDKSAVWAHVSCALWVPEATFHDTILLYPIESLEKVPKSRLNLVGMIRACLASDMRQTCQVCRRAGRLKRWGAPVQVRLFVIVASLPDVFVVYRRRLRVCIPCHVRSGGGAIYAIKPRFRPALRSVLQSTHSSNSQAGSPYSGAPGWGCCRRSTRWQVHIWSDCNYQL